MISVLIPTRSRPDPLRQALASLLRQTFTRFESVVVDDGEGEGLEVVASMADPRLRALPSPVMGGVKARMEAPDHTRGKAAGCLSTVPCSRYATPWPFSRPAWSSRSASPTLPLGFPPRRGFML
ncbi:glycosyltransferase family 2 protein [Thermus scotoductus]|uniref:glycosyltransferase family 2 protein n=1 Tax=Thermus scotoductus TaxID=37636 RepID=UPI0020A59FBE|nr:glycosyltransferase [Thermus scotoductus]